MTGRDCFTDFREVEDEYGRESLRAGAARVFIRDIAAKHPYIVRSVCR